MVVILKNGQILEHFLDSGMSCDWQIPIAFVINQVVGNPHHWDLSRCLAL
jgi:hypothetical protein